MADMYARITGRVLNAERRSGTNDRGPWSFLQADILVADRGVSTVTVDDTVTAPRAGDEVDYLARLSSGKFGPRINAVSDFPVFSDTYSASS